jgi:hypothetical protein
MHSPPKPTVEKEAKSAKEACVDLTPHAIPNHLEAAVDLLGGKKAAGKKWWKKGPNYYTQGKTVTCFKIRELLVRQKSLVIHFYLHCCHQQHHSSPPPPPPPPPPLPTSAYCLLTHWLT